MLKKKNEYNLMSKIKNYIFYFLKQKEREREREKKYK